MPDYYLGLDGGATKTQAVVIDNFGKQVARGQAGGSNASVLGLSKALENVQRAITGAVKEKKLPIKSACLAIAGVNTQEEKNQWQRAIKNHPKLAKVLTGDFLVVNDTLAALRSGTTEPNALVIIAGTGSNCWGKNESGQEAQSGGVDYILSDEGSAYAIGSAILHSVVKALDGRGNQTALKNLLFEKYKIDSLEKLILLVYSKRWDKIDIARIAPIAELAASKGDKVAQTVLREAAEDLVLMAKAVGKKLGFLKKSFAVVTSGSVFENSKIVSNHFERGILEFNGSAKIIKPRVTSAQAAALLAKEFFG